MSSGPVELVEMGEIVRAVGLRGEVKVVPTGDFLEPVFDSSFLRRRHAQDVTRAEVERIRWKGETVILKLADLSDRSAAEQAVGDTLGFAADDYDHPDFPRPEEPAPFLYHDLTIETVEGEIVGSVTEVLVYPANLVLRVARDDDEVLIPVIAPVVREFDRKGGRLVIEPMPGLLDDEAEVVT